MELVKERTKRITAFLKRKHRIESKTSSKPINETCTTCDIYEEMSPIDIAEKLYTRKMCKTFFDHHHYLVTCLGIDDAFPEVSVVCEEDFPTTKQHYQSLQAIYVNGLTTYLNLIRVNRNTPIYDKEKVCEAIIEDIGGFKDSVREHLLNNLIMVLCPKVMTEVRINEDMPVLYRADHLRLLAGGKQMLKDAKLSQLFNLLLALYRHYELDFKSFFPLSAFHDTLVCKFGVLDREFTLDEVSLQFIEDFVRHFGRLYNGTDVMCKHHIDYQPYKRYTDGKKFYIRQLVAEPKDVSTILFKQD